MAKSNIFYDKYAKTKRRLFIFFLVMAFVSLGAGLGILKLSNIKTVRMGLETVYEDRVMPLKLLKSLSDMYAIDIVDTANKVLNANMSWHEGRKILEETTKRMPGLWNEYIKTYLIEEEKKVIDQLQTLFESADQASMRLKKIFLDEDSKALAEFVKKDLYRRIEPVTDKIGELFEMQVRIVKDINDREEIRYKFALSAGMASIAMSLILSILVLLQWRRVRMLIDSLS
jgi:methyl-accepting chemotaxis protein